MGKGFGDVSDSMAWLPPVNVTATLGVALPTESATVTGVTAVDNPNVLQWGFALEYSLLTNSCSADEEVLTASPRVWCRWWNSQCRRH